MYNFDFHLATNIHFGRGSVTSSLVKELGHGKNVFFVYDEVPVKASGLYDEIISALKAAGVRYQEFTGVEPNPRHTTVNRGIAALKEFNADCIVAAGGGSTLDCAKAISFGVYHDGDVWDFYSGRVPVEKVMPVIAIPTLAASGAEVSFSAVISNMGTRQKIGLRNEKIRPTCAILDPTYTFSVPKFHTACGVVDIMSHTYESYFCNDSGTIPDGFSEAIQRACVESGPKVMVNPSDYDTRAELMWAAVLSISHLSACGRPVFNSPIHALEHILSAYYDIVHGAGIAIISLSWFRYALTDENAPRFAKWAKNVWGLEIQGSDREAGEAAILAFESFCRELGLPTRLSEVNIGRKQIEEIVEAEFAGLKGNETWFRPVTSKEELLAVYALAL